MRRKPAGRRSGSPARALAGTAAPLNPSYKEEEFRFYLEDTNAKVLLLPPEGLDDARQAAAANHVPILTVEMDGSGTVSLRGVTERQPVASPDPDDVALILHTSGSTGRPKRVPLSHAKAGRLFWRVKENALPGREIFRKFRRQRIERDAS